MSTSETVIGEVPGIDVRALLGDVCAAVDLEPSKMYGTGWNAVASGWGLGVLTGVPLNPRSRSASPPKAASHDPMHPSTSQPRASVP